MPGSVLVRISPPSSPRSSSPPLASGLGEAVIDESRGNMHAETQLSVLQANGDDSRTELSPNDQCCSQQPDGHILPLVWWWWRAYGEGVDDYQREAVLRWRFGADGPYDCGGFRGRNKWIQYPRTTSRFSEKAPLQSFSSALSLLLDTFNCDTVSEMLWSPMVVVWSNIIAILMAITTYLTFEDVWCQACAGASEIPFWGPTISTLITIVYFAVVGFLVNAFFRFGNNVFASYYVLWVGLAVLVLRENKTYAFIVHLMTGDAIDVDHYFETDYFWPTSGTGAVQNYISLTYHFMGIMISLIALCLVLQLWLPSTLVRRHYNYRYVKELVSNRRGYVIPADTGFVARKYKVFAHAKGAEGEEYTDVVSYAQRLQDVGANENEICESIERNWREQGDHHEKSRAHASTAAPSHNRDMFAEMRHAVMPDLHEIKNPHAQIKWTVDPNVHGNVIGELSVLPVRIKSALFFTMILSIAACVVIHILEPKMFSCYKNIERGRCHTPAILQPDNIHGLYGLPTGHSSDFKITSYTDLLPTSCQECAGWHESVWFLFLGSSAVMDSAVLNQQQFDVNTTGMPPEVRADYELGIVATMTTPELVSKSFSALIEVQQGIRLFTAAKSTPFPYNVVLFDEANYKFKAAEVQYDSITSMMGNKTHNKATRSYLQQAGVIAEQAANSNATSTTHYQLPDPNGFYMATDWMFGVLAANVKMGYTTLAQDMEPTASKLLRYIKYSSVALIFVSLWACIAVMQGYRKMVFEARAQTVVHWERDSKLYTPFYTASYFLSQAVYHHIPWAILMVAFVAIAMSFTTDTGLAWWSGWFLPHVATVCISYLVSSVLLRILVWDRFFVTDGSVTRRHWFFFFDLAINLLQIVIIFINVSLRIGLQIFVIIMSLFRIDISVLPMGFETYDQGFAGFVAIMYMYERHAGPILTEFVDSLCAPTMPMRGVEHMRRDINNGRLEATPERMQKLEAAEQALEIRAAIIGEQYKDKEKLRLFTDDVVAALRPFYVARNRWHHAFLLIRNPSLKKYRVRNATKIKPHKNVFNSIRDKFHGASLPSLSGEESFWNKMPTWRNSEPEVSEGSSSRTEEGHGPRGNKEAETLKVSVGRSEIVNL